MRRAAVAAACASALLLAWTHTSDAHGTVDQRMDGDPDCNVFNLSAAVSQAGGQRQTFTPSVTGLSGVDVCIPSGEGTIDVVIRDASNTVIGGGSAEITHTGDGFTHVNFPAPYEVTAGDTLTIELVSSAEVAWHGNAAGDPYTYAGGSANGSGVDDFAFRSYYAPLPATAVPSATKTAPPSPTRTRTPTRTPEPTATPQPIVTPPPAPAAVATSTPSDAPPPPAVSATASGRGARPGASPTRTSGVLGAQQTAGRIFLPDVGDGSASTGAAPERQGGGVIAVIGVAAALLLAAVSARAIRSGRLR